jgi:hypothetical protein
MDYMVPYPCPFYPMGIIFSHYPMGIIFSHLQTYGNILSHICTPTGIEFLPTGLQFSEGANKKIKWLHTSLLKQDSVNSVTTYFTLLLFSFPFVPS